MGLISKVAKVAKAGAKVVAKSPVTKYAKFIPGPIGTVATAIGAASSAYGAYKTIKGVVGTKGAPTMPSVPSFSLPSLPGVTPNKGAGRAPMPMPGQTGGGWNPLKWIPRGPGGRMQMPWNDPSVPAFLKQFALDDSFIRPAMRAPKGYVIVRDADGQPYPVLKKVAQQFGLWKPAHKPPISVGDYQALKRADRTVKKMRKIYATIARVDKATTKGGKVTIHRKKGGN